MGQSGVALYAGVAQRRIFVAPEGEDGLIHLLGVENLEPNEQVEILHRQPGNGQKQVRLELGDDILQCVLAEVGQVHKCRNARSELDQLLLDELALGLVFLFFFGELLLPLADDPFDTISGTLGLTGAPDTILVLDRDRSGSFVLHGKGRDLIEIEKAVTFDQDSCTWCIAGDAAVIRRSAERNAILGAIREAGERGQTTSASCSASWSTKV